MSRAVRRLLFWTPRIICILFALLVSLFALDVFGQGQPLWRQILGFLIHLVPAYILVIVLIVSRRWEWVGGVIFPALGIIYIYMTRGRFPWLTYLVMAGPPILLGALFMAGWFLRAQVRSRN